MSDHSTQKTPIEPIQFALSVMTLEAADALAATFSQMQPWNRYAFTAAQLSAVLMQQGDGAAAHVILCDVTIAGAAVIKRKWLAGPYLQILGVLPEFSRRGLGSAFLRHFEDTARRDQARNLWVAASDVNQDALRFYQRHGFQTVAQLDDLLRDGMHECLLRKRLNKTSIASKNVPA